MNKKIFSVISSFFLFLFFFVFANISSVSAAVIEIAPPDNAPSGIGPLVSAGINAVIIIAGLLVFIYLVWGGIEWLTSGGDKEKYESARNRITAAVIGLVIVVAAWAIMSLIGNFFGINFKQLTIKPVSEYSNVDEVEVDPNNPGPGIN